MVHYLFDDVFYKFRSFFNTIKNENSKFLYDISFGLKPRIFKPGEAVASIHLDGNDQDIVIYDEEDEVPEMYLIKQGTIGIGFYVMSKQQGSKNYKIGIKVNSGSYICDYYVCHNKKSQFVYVAQTEVTAYALSKRFL
jgi:hypothetical protein